MFVANISYSLLFNFKNYSHFCSCISQNICIISMKKLTFPTYDNKRKVPRPYYANVLDRHRRCQGSDRHTEGCTRTPQYQRMRFSHGNYEA